MDIVPLSDLERYYIIKGAELGCRPDGRAPNQYRPLELETGILSHASGSASIRIGGTYLIGCVKVEVGKPLMSKPNEGRLEINVECYPTATCTSTDRGANEIADNLKTTLQSAYATDYIDLHGLCILPGRQCWVVYIDLLILEGDGNFLDAASLIIKAALLDCSSEMRTLWMLVKMKKLVPYHVYPDGRLGPMSVEGCGSCQLETIMKMTELAKKTGCELSAALLKTLDLERQLRS